MSNQQQPAGPPTGPPLIIRAQGTVRPGGPQGTLHIQAALNPEAGYADGEYAKLDLPMEEIPRLVKAWVNAQPTKNSMAETPTQYHQLKVRGGQHIIAGGGDNGADFLLASVKPVGMCTDECPSCPDDNDDVDTSSDLA